MNKAVENYSFLTYLGKGKQSGVTKSRLCGMWNQFGGRRRTRWSWKVKWQLDYEGLSAR